jgi:hypothetical protein
MAGLAIKECLVRDSGRAQGNSRGYGALVLPITEQDQTS